MMETIWKTMIWQQLGAAIDCVFDWLEMSFGELLLYNMRHVQHHTAQLNLLLRQTVDAAPRWVARAEA